MTRRFRVLGLALGAALFVAPLAAQKVAPPPPPAPRGWIGVSYETTKTQEGLRLRPVSLVVEVRDGSPAAGAGIRAGDVLVSINGRPWEEQFSKGAPPLRPGDPVTLVLDRAGGLREVQLIAGTWPVEGPKPGALKVTVMPDSVVDRLYLAMDSLRVRIVEDEGLRYRIAEMEVAADSILEDLARRRVVQLPALPIWEGAGAATPFAYWVMGDSLKIVTEWASPFIWSIGDSAAPVREFRPTVPYVLGENRVAGAEVVDLRAELAGYFGVDGGVLVVDVAPGTPAARAGVTPGDVLTHADGVPVRAIADLRKGLIRGGHEIPLTLIRKGRAVQLVLRR